MIYFEQIYQAALKQDEKELEQALSKAAIDELKLEAGIILTAAGKLAAEGKLHAANFLQKHGASTQYITLGLALHNGYSKELKGFLIKHSERDILMAAASRPSPTQWL